VALIGPIQRQIGGSARTASTPSATLRNALPYQAEATGGIGRVDDPTRPGLTNSSASPTLALAIHAGPWLTGVPE
jgi:hypothetical protein